MKPANLILPGLAMLFLVALWVIWATNALSRPSTLRTELRQVDQALLLVLQTSGAAVEPNHAKPGMILEKVVQFRLPQCKDPFVVVPLRIGQSNEAILNVLVEDEGISYETYSIYRGKVIKGYAFVEFQLQSMITEMWQVLGAADVRFTRHALMLMIPADCADLPLANWTEFWQNTAT